MQQCLHYDSWNFIREIQLKFYIIYLQTYIIPYMSSGHFIVISMKKIRFIIFRKQRVKI